MREVAFAIAMMGGTMLARSPIERSKIRNYIKTGLAGLK